MPRLRLVEKPAAAPQKAAPVISPIQPEVAAGAAPKASTMRNVNVETFRSATLDTSGAFLKAIATGNDEAAFSALRGTDGSKLVCDAAIKLDVLYRARQEGRVLSGELAASFTAWNKEMVEELISIFTCAVDYTYTNRETQVKLALTKALALAKRIHTNNHSVGRVNEFSM